jgi:hypothetical protein
MSQYLFPIVIESRKVVFMNLKNKNYDSSNFSEYIEDTFVVSMPEGIVNRTEIASIKESTIIQALGVGLKDIKFDILRVSINKSLVDDSIFELVLSETNSENKSVEITKDFKLEIQSASSGALKILFINNGTSRMGFKLNLVIKLAINTSDPTVINYAALCTFHIVPKSEIRFLALDFGSEASQMKDGRYVSESSMTVHHDSVDLFRLIRNKCESSNEYKNENYEQYESDRLYKSVFYVDAELAATKSDHTIQGHEFYWLDGGLNMLVASNEVNSRNAPFLSNKFQIPNLKLIKSSIGQLNGAEFEIKTGSQSNKKSFNEIKGTLYIGLLKEMLGVYLSQRVEKKLFFRLIVLVPNIYTPEDIQETRRILVDIMQLNQKEITNINSFEIDCISESDASFLGCKSHIQTAPNQFYIIVDCGKGTTDYSILEIEQGAAQTCRSLYRNGFAGAGNFITYAFVKAACHFMAEELFDDEDKREKVKTFLEGKFKSDDLYFHKEFFKNAERWKRMYSSSCTFSKEDIESGWKSARTGKITFDLFFELWPKSVDDSTFFELLSMVNYSYDWNNYIANAIHEIVEQIREQVEPVIVYLSAHSKCGGILLTGRGSMFEPLANAISNELKSLRGMEKMERISVNQQNLKEVCLEGIFSQSLRYYADLASTPVEVDIKTSRRVEKKKTNCFLKLLGLGSNVGAPYDPDSNSIEVINSHDLSNTRFLIGGRFYSVKANDFANSGQCYLVPTRGGTFFVVKDQSGVVLDIYGLSAEGSMVINEERILDSLYPSWYRQSILKTL